MNGEHPAEGNVEIAQISKGSKQLYVGRNGLRTVTLGQTYRVLINETIIGSVTRELVDQSHKTPGLTYVNRRWQTPAWVANPTRSTHYHAPHFYDTKKEAIEALIERAERQTNKVSDGS